MTMRMLIDARHREETRVAVVKGSRIEEFDFESAEHKQLKGNIYLAKVTRVEPSLQAAFVDYGGNRHGFLAFAEIHPDYYQIPKEDREALLREEAEHAAEEEALRAAEDDFEPIDGHHDDDGHDDERPDADDEHDDDGEAPAPVATGNGGDEKAADALRAKRMNLRRRYKIQDVIRRRQVLLVQVVKEERGNKGAALTSYLSLAGRYCVLMPNTSHGGGISRKISNAADRKRLKSIMADLALPKTMGCIVRTAGLQRTKVEIRRDFDYLARLWDEIRENTLASAAPALIHQDSDLIKRAIRDIYHKDIEEVVVEGSEGYAHAKQFMKLLMPSHARRVKPYVDTVPLFQRAHVEDQLAAMYNPVVQLKSGGYLVINPTEALVSIDINSGRSTREHGIEATAVNTNLEAAHEIARQLRLRDMAGLVVIDFIDMESNGNIRKVEKAMKAALSDDRARIQVGRISSFGLMEMSRQRLRTGVLEASTRQCPHCEGTGLVRTASSAGLSALRMLEDEAGRGRGSRLVLTASKEAALYVLNKKRAELAEIEARYGVIIEVASDNEEEGARMTVEVSGPPPAFTPRLDAPAYEEEDDEVFEEEIDEEEVAEEEDEPRGERRPREARERSEGEGEGEGRGRRRRRRGRRGRRDEGGEGAERPAREPVEGEAAEAPEGEEVAEREVAPREEGDRKRRNRRGGRRRRGRGDADRTPAEVAEDAAADAAEAAGETVEAAPVEAEADAPPVKPKRTRKPKAEAVVEAEPVASVEEAVAEKPKRTRKAKVVDAEAAPAAEAEPAPAEKPKRTRKVKAEPVAEAATAETAPSTEGSTEADGTRRGGWWQRTFGATE
ncbi:ribonuclease E/G [Sphingomonas sp. SUN039]|uniref:Rne/Rng family ribonuclease n=1 Tax=Sphingomonas sp. SUN039 TaxID=2937787 RepID=UPI0021642E3B|nr:ribonuclease E/G [Sphingomonas sp. SUN039]UVO55642.1 Rne/Rng family ribonuclease [Sphingomonas sp. SUN039]